MSEYMSMQKNTDLRDFDAKSDQSLSAGGLSGVFSTANSAEYERWREEKLANFPAISEISVNISDPANPSRAEISAITALLKREIGRAHV